VIRGASAAPLLPHASQSRWRSREAGTLARAAAASLAATVVDGAAYQGWLSVAPSRVAHYAWAAAVGALLGAVTNFSLNRWWAFRAQDARLLPQALRYAVGSALTLLALQGVLWVLVERLSLGSNLAWLPAKLVTWAAFSYPFQRALVFAGGRR